MNGRTVKDVPGRTCPLSYAYDPAVFRRVPDFSADALIVAGGLYGNLQALDAVEALARREPNQAARLVFNGDFHWFDVDPTVFAEVNRRVLSHTALRGNVETELAGEDQGAGCGCAYPLQVSDDEVGRSNRILARLRRTAAQAGDQARQALGALPMHAVAQVGAARVAIVHGDYQSLAGWEFARDALDDPARQESRQCAIRQANVDLFASSHTCLPVFRSWDKGSTREWAVINNGAAGMPNFAGTRFGIVTRIGVRPAPRGMPVLLEARQALNGGELFVAAVALEFDDASWRERFLADWPTGSDAHASYWDRIENGPAYGPEQAFGNAMPVDVAA